MCTFSKSILFWNMTECFQSLSSMIYSKAFLARYLVCGGLSAQMESKGFKKQFSIPLFFSMVQQLDVAG